MAISKLILDNTTQMDVTQDTVTAGSMLSGVTAHKNDGTIVTGNIQSKSSADLTSSTLTVTAPSGYYSTAATKTLSDGNLTEGNIKKDVTIFGVTGTYEGGGGTVKENDVNFYDYDGTLVYSYSAADFANLSALPANPSHTGLTAQGWNWSLSDAKTYVADNGKLVIGQTYVTDDGKTRLYMTIINANFALTLYLQNIGLGNVVVNWGDGSSEETFTTFDIAASHTYVNAGEYIITVYFATSGGRLGRGTNTGSLFGDHRDGDPQKAAQSLTKVEIGQNMERIYEYVFHNCSCLESITMPDNTHCGDSYLFSSCRQLRYITIPNSTNTSTIGSYAFQQVYLDAISLPKSINTIKSNLLNYAYTLKNVTIPPNVSTINSSVFGNVVCMQYIVIPSNISTISSSSFAYCYSMKEYHFKRTTPPTLSNTNAFTSIPSTCKIYVPYSSDHSILNAYKTANNWSTYANQIVEEPA